MKKNLLTILFFLSINLLAQQSEVDKLRQHFESFEYQDVIDSAARLVQSGTLSNALLTEVYEMLAISYYSLGDEASAKINFEQLIKLNKNYSPDPSKISPKVVGFFNDVKSAMAAQQENNPAKDSLSAGNNLSFKPDIDYRGAFLKNMVLPGWGQISSSQTIKGAVMSGVSLALIGGMTAYIIDTNNKQKDYLNETDKTLIQFKYDAYNSAYKTRNLFIISYIAVWLYSQIDLLLFNNYVEPIGSQRLNTSFRINPLDEIQFNIRLSF